MIEKIKKRFIKPNFPIARDILILVGKHLRLNTYENLSTKELNELVDYAGAMHLIASDNDICLPEKPEIFDKLPDFEIDFKIFE